MLILKTGNKKKTKIQENFKKFWRRHRHSTKNNKTIYYITKRLTIKMDKKGTIKCELNKFKEIVRKIDFS